MSRILVAFVAVLAVTSLSGCESIGKGKGKAPPPVAEEPAAAPVYK
ncbi:ABC transporter [Phyllobacterium zundukense]|uniref:ABC transporter n=1 Tax=Phyllobacterium zundukense TaxID=1867719 RepID=A0A2N9W425_9HYPH|nr:ABC transporter [Phyllobacterium zundukense]PIO46493.1 ABC transporter [Phyllobacterium zundukense]